MAAGADAAGGSVSGVLPVTPLQIRCRLGDGPNWNDPDLNDDDWALTDGFIYPLCAAGASEPLTPMWFRFRIEIAPEAVGVPLVIQAYPIEDDMQVFLNGVRVAGPQNLDPSAGVTPRCIVPLRTDNMVALRWIPNKSARPESTSQTTPIMCSLSFLDSSRTLDDYDRREMLERAYAAHRIALTAVFIVFFLFHLALYGNYSFRRENFYCCITALLCALALASLHVSEVYNYDRVVWRIAYSYCFLALTPLSIVSAFGLFQLVFARRLRRTLYLYLALGILCYLASLRFGNDVVHLFPLFTVPELVWIILAKRRGGPPLFGWPTMLVAAVILVVTLNSIASFYELDAESGFLRYSPWYVFAAFLQFVSFVFAREYADAQRRIKEFADSLEQKVEERTRELTAAAAEIKTLQGILPICMYCHRIRDDHESWLQLDLYVREHSDVEFSHGLCPECLKEHYPDMAEG